MLSQDRYDRYNINYLVASACLIFMRILSFFRISQVILPVGGSDIHILRRGRAFARIAGHDSGSIDNNSGKTRRDYFQEGEALCREGRLNTTAAMSPGKLVSVTLRSLEGIHITGGSGGARSGSVAYNCNVNQNNGTKMTGNGGDRRINGKCAITYSINVSHCNVIYLLVLTEGRRRSFKRFMSARRGSIARRGSGFEKFLGNSI